jgi:serine protease AprX
VLAASAPRRGQPKLVLARIARMKRSPLVAAAIGALIVAACQDGPLSPNDIAPNAVGSRSLIGAGATLDPLLLLKLTTALPSDQIVVIANYAEESADPLAVTRGIMRTGAGVIRFKHLPMVAALATPSQVLAMRGVSGVTAIFANKPIQYLLRESRAVIQADQVHVSGITGKGVGVAILDSGIDGLNPALAYPGKTVANVKVLTSVKDLVTFGDDPTTPKIAGALVVENLPNSEAGNMGHGTHVAGIVGGDSTSVQNGIYKGVAPGVRLVGIATGEGPTVLYALAGFDWLLEHRVQYNIQVVNNSWGSNGDFDPNDPINIASKKTHDAGVTVVFASGNCGQGEDATCRPPGENQLNPYSVAPWVIGVAAGCKYNVPDPTNSVGSTCLDAQGRTVLANFSSRGIPGDSFYHPTVTAPGVRIVSTRATTGTTMNALDANSDVRLCNSSVANLQWYTCASGTSMATPHIAGVVALMIEAAKGTLTPDRAKEVLAITATRLPGYAPYEVGAGYANALAAVNYVRR